MKTLLPFLILATTALAQSLAPLNADGVPMGAIKRVPAAGEARSNMHVGGRPEKSALTARDLEIAEALGPVLAARGLLLVGLDIIGDRLTEINVTSPTCFQEIHDQVGCDVASIFIDALEQA